MLLRIDRHEDGDGVVMLTLGPAEETENPVEIDLLASEQFQAAIDSWNASGKPSLILDLSQVSYLHSRPFWAIVRAAEEAARRGGAVVLVGLSDSLKRMVDLTTAADVALVRTTVEDARRAFHEKTKTPDKLA